jgi:hypothetical protein
LYAVGTCLLSRHAIVRARSSRWSGHTLRMIASTLVDDGGAVVGGRVVVGAFVVGGFVAGGFVAGGEVVVGRGAVVVGRAVVGVAVVGVAVVGAAVVGAAVVGGAGVEAPTGRQIERPGRSSVLVFALFTASRSDSRTSAASAMRIQ